MSSSEAAHIPIFAALSSKDRDKVLNNATLRTYAPGATLVAEGERSLNLFFIASGHARVDTAGERPPPRPRPRRLLRGARPHRAPPEDRDGRGGRRGDLRHPSGVGVPLAAR